MARRMRRWNSSSPAAAVLPCVVFVVGLLLLSAAWVVSNPVGNAPDETAQYVKALGAGRGDLDGQALTPEEGRRTDSLQLNWVRAVARAVDVPTGLSPEGVNCHVSDATRPAACLYEVRTPQAPTRELTHNGTYQPAPYVLPGVLAGRAHTPFTGMWLARTANAVTCLALVAGAVALLRDRAGNPLALLGLVAALTPMVVFLASSVSASGPEAAGAVAFGAAVLRIAREERPPPWVWAGAGLSGAVLASSRSLGVLWVALIGLVLLGACGVRSAWWRFRGGGAAAAAAAAVAAAGVAASVAWEALVQPRAPRSARVFRDWLVPSLLELPKILEQWTGVFGSLDTRMPQVAYASWALLLFAVVLFASLLGDRRERLVLASLVGASALVTVVVAAGHLRQVGFGMQGRYTLPLAVVVPLFAGEVVFRHRDELPTSWPRQMVLGATVVSATVQAVGWYANARRAAVGTRGPVLFWDRPSWSPPFGWAPWVVLAVGGAAAILAAGVLAYRRPLEARREELLAPNGSRAARAEPLTGSAV